MLDTIDFRTDHLRRALLADPEMCEIARARAWLDVGARSLRLVGGRLVGVPDGWPPGVADPDSYLTALVDRGLYGDIA